MLNRSGPYRRLAIHVGRLLAACSVVGAGEHAWSQTEFLIRMRDGNQWVAKVEANDLPWGEIRADGSVVERIAPLSSIRSIEFSELSVRESAQEIRNLLEQLGSADYHTRNRSEEALLKKGGQFVDLIEHAKANSNPEVRYRVGRLLTKLRAKGVKQVSAEYDEIFLDGATDPIRGDLGDWNPTIHLLGRTLAINRKSVLSIQQLANSEEAVAGGAPPSAAMSVSEPEPEFFRPGDVHIDFDHGRRGESFLVSENISHAFLDRGVLLSGGEDPATSVIAAGFRIPQARSAKNSAATMTLGDRYKGTLRIDFCLPSLAEVPATVYRVGCYIAVVQDPGEIVLRAYDRHGNLIGSALAMGKTSFVGVVSPQPIAWATISSNRDLPVAAAEIDDDFAIDDLVFDPPQLDRMRACGQQVTVSLHDGTRVSGTPLTIEAEAVVLESTALGSEPLRLALGDVRAIAWGNRSLTPRASELWGMLRDGTTLPLTVPAAEQIQVSGGEPWDLPRSELAGLFGGDNGLRFPFNLSVAADRPLALFPFGSLALSQLQIQPNGVSWAAESNNLVPPSGLESLPNPNYPAEFPLANAPSIWLAAPPQLEAAQGLLDLTGRQEIVLNQAGPFKLSQWSSENVIVKAGTHRWTIPWSEVKAIQFPQR